MEQEEIVLAKNHYKSIYYANGVPESMHCGWSSHEGQLEAYEAFLNLFDVGGEVLDLGCGNGALLKFLLENTKVRLTPYGVDFLEESILEAKEIILPAFKENFFIKSVDEFNPNGQMYRYIITSPDYTFGNDQVKFVMKCFDWLTPNGKLILYDYKGSNEFDTFELKWKKLDIGIPKLIKTSLTSIVWYAKLKNSLAQFEE